MVAHQLRDHAFAEQATRGHHFRREQPVEHRRQIGLQPRAHRRAEAALLAVEDVGRQQVGQRLLHQVLQAPAFDLDRRRHGRRHLDQLMVEQRHPAFQRHGHAHLVGQQQQVVGQLRLRVDGEHAVELVALAGGLEGARQRVVGERRLLAQQVAHRLAADQLQVAAVALVGAHVGRRDEALHQPQLVVDLRMPVGRQPPGHVAGARAQPAGQPPELLGIVPAQVAPVAAEEFVTTHARQDHLDILPRELRHQVGGDEGRIGNRFVQMPQQPRQQRHHVRLDNDLAVLRAETLRHLARIGQLVVQRLGGAAVEADRIGADRLLRVLGHETDHGAGIDPARKEGADRHVADHLHAHRLLELCTHLVHPLRFGGLAVDGLGQPPVAPLAHLAAFDGQQRGRRQLAQALEDAGRRSHVAQLQIARQHGGVEFGLDARQRQQRLGLAGEGQARCVAQHVQRLDAQPVAADQQPAPACVPQAEVEHAIQAQHNVVAPRGIAVQQHLAVRSRLEAVAQRLQLGAQLAVVVDLAVAHQPERAVGVAQRLVATGQVDDRQAPHGDAAFTVDMHALVVRAAVARDVAHCRQQPRRHRLAVEADESVNAAHGRQAASASTRPRRCSARR